MASQTHRLDVKASDKRASLGSEDGQMRSDKEEGEISRSTSQRPPQGSRHSNGNRGSVTATWSNPLDRAVPVARDAQASSSRPRSRSRSKERPKAKSSSIVSPEKRSHAKDVPNRSRDSNGAPIDSRPRDAHPRSVAPVRRQSKELREGSNRHSGDFESRPQRSAREDSRHDKRRDDYPDDRRWREDERDRRRRYDDEWDSHFRSDDHHFYSHRPREYDDRSYHGYDRRDNEYDNRDRRQPEENGYHRSNGHSRQYADHPRSAEKYWDSRGEDKRRAYNDTRDERSDKHHHRSSRSPDVHRRRQRSVSKAEEGEIPDEPSPRARTISPDRKSDDGPPPGNESAGYAPLRIKRPTNRNHQMKESEISPDLAPSAPVPPSATPQPPEEDAPPPPPPGSPPPSAPVTSETEPHTPASESPSHPHVRTHTTNSSRLGEGEAPVNKVLRATQSAALYDDVSGYSGSQSIGATKKKLEVPNAPNPNIRDPPTRPGTPSRPEDIERLANTPKRQFRRPTEAEESRTMHRLFKGTTTLSAYDLGKKLGEGTFGVVTKGKETATGRPVALKKLIMHNMRDGVSMTTIREIKILKTLLHVNVVPILDMVVQPRPPADKSGRQDIFMVFPFMDHDLCGLLANPDFRMSPSIAKLFMEQILSGMAYIHAQGYIHRDIKTANILVNQHGLCMIADFGLARAWSDSSELPLHSSNEYTNMVVTRWYRAPELLLGARKYGPEIDMWSIGCVMGEMFRKDPWLAGETDRDQLFKIFAHCGPLNEDTMPGWKQLDGFPDAVGHPWDSTPAGQPLLEMAQSHGIDRVGADLLVKLLVLDPKRRLTADEALDHPWFFTNPLPASVESTDLKVASSHEMTTSRRKHEPIQRPVQAAVRGPRPIRPPPAMAPAWAQTAHIPPHPLPPMAHIGNGFPANVPPMFGNQPQHPPHPQAYPPPMPMSGMPPMVPSSRVPPAPFKLRGAPAPPFGLASNPQKRGPPPGAPVGPGAARDMGKRPKMDHSVGAGLNYG